MRSKELSIQVKQTIVRLQKQNKSIREIAITFGVAKSTVWCILRKRESTSELSNIKRPGCPQRTTVVDACMASSGTGLLVFIDDVTEDRSSQKNSEVYGDILSAQTQSNAAKLIGRCFVVQMDDDPKHTAKATQKFLKVKKWNILQWPSQSPDFNPIEHAFHLLKTNHKGGNPVFADIHEFQT